MDVSKHIANRKKIRKKLAFILKGTMRSVQAITPYEPIFEGQSPILFIISAGSNRGYLTKQGLNNEFYFDVHTMVLASQEDDGYTQENAEDLLDDIDAEFALFLNNNRECDGYWIAIDQVEMSNARTAVIENGEKYIQEIRTLLIKAVP